MARLRNAVPQRLLGDLEQLGDFAGDLADRHGERGIAVPAFVDRTGVDGEDVALDEPVVIGDAVDDHLVRRQRRSSPGSRGS